MIEIDLKKVLIQHGCTQAKFSAESGVSLATISKICNDPNYQPTALIQSKINNTLVRLGYFDKDE
jgi:transcriptional regulator with XRE-family HTH domain